MLGTLQVASCVLRPSLQCEQTPRLGGSRCFPVECNFLANAAQEKSSELLFHIEDCLLVNWSSVQAHASYLPRHSDHYLVTVYPELRKPTRISSKALLFFINSMLQGTFHHCFELRPKSLGHVMVFRLYMRPYELNLYNPAHTGTTLLTPQHELDWRRWFGHHEMHVTLQE
jgi:hypothetical protein